MAEVEVADPQQLDIELSFPLSQPAGKSYSVELFLFVPREVGVSAQNYGRETFYTDLTTYLRLDGAPLDLPELADLGNPLSPLFQLSQSLSLLERDIHVTPDRPIISLVQLFGYSFREAVRASRHRLEDETSALFKADPGERQDKKGEWLLHIESLCQHGSLAVRAFRHMRRRFAPLAGTRPAAVREAFDYVDEYVSFFLIEQLARLAKKLQERTRDHGSCVVQAALGRLRRSSLVLTEQRRLEGFAAPRAEDQHAAEFFTYRHELIKRSMQQAFYLETRAVRRDPYLRNAVAMVAAGLAAIWSLVTQVPAAIGRLTLKTRMLMLLFVVLAYALKDRIKDLSKDYLMRRLRKFDFDTDLVGEHLTELGLSGVSVRARERFAWLLPARVPAPLLQLRLRPRTVAGSDIAGEDVLHYARQLTFAVSRGKKLPAGFALRDILRLNLRHFMTRLHDSKSSVSYYDPEGDRFVSAKTPRVYHLNLLLRVRDLYAGKETLSRYRVILNKERIVRVEPVGPVGPLGIERPDHGTSASSP